MCEKIPTGCGSASGVPQQDTEDGASSHSPGRRPALKSETFVDFLPFINI